MPEGFLPKRGHYKNLLSYQKSLMIYDCTYIFCERFFHKFNRTIDQMVQAARSGKQNIIEGSKAAITSTETELKLTNVARASLDELLEDYHDYLRVNKLGLWDKNSKEASYVRNLSSGKIQVPKSIIKNIENSHHLSEIHQVFISFIENKPAKTCANIMICLINQCNFLLDKQIKKQEEVFVKNGGLRETMFKARLDYRNKQ